MLGRKGKSSVTTAERIQTHVEALPPPLQQEVLDFVEYLRLKAKQDQDVPLRQRRAWTKAIRQVVSELRQGAEGYSDEAIDDFVDETVEAVRRDSQQTPPKSRR
jgi:hypothetical protein